MKIFALYDSKAEAYLRPFFNKSKGEALRNLIDAINEKDSHLGKHATDFSLFELGEYDELKGALLPLKSPKHVANAWELKENGPTTLVQPNTLNQNSAKPVREAMVPQDNVQ